MGSQHQAGSDSCHTAATFFRLKELYYPSHDGFNPALDNLHNLLYGLDATSNAPYWADKENATYYDYATMSYCAGMNYGYMCPYPAQSQPKGLSTLPKDLERPASAAPVLKSLKPLSISKAQAN